MSADNLTTLTHYGWATVAWMKLNEAGLVDEAHYTQAHAILTPLFEKAIRNAVERARQTFPERKEKG